MHGSGMQPFVPLEAKILQGQPDATADSEGGSGTPIMATPHPHASHSTGHFNGHKSHNRRDLPLRLPAGK